jgi:putative membrane protein
MTPDLVSNVVAATLFAVLGIVIFVLAFVIVDRLTPGDLWRDLLQERNTALAIVMAGIAIGLSIIIAAAIH